MSNSKIRFGIFVFPGSNCDHDCYHGVKHIMGQEAKLIWHGSPDISGCDALILPGGFSYGDYLRPGALAKISPALTEISRFAKEGRPVLGICNGFQILTESGLLPGALLRNSSLKFICKNLRLKTGRNNTPFTNKLKGEKIITMPVAHADGSYYADPDTLKQLEDEESILFKYCDERGEVLEESNPNGSKMNIAGICNKRGNVLGMMPHPERVLEKELGCEDGKFIFESIIESIL